MKVEIWLVMAKSIPANPIPVEEKIASLKTKETIGLIQSQIDGLEYMYMYSLPGC